MGFGNTIKPQGLEPFQFPTKIGTASSTPAGFAFLLNTLAFIGHTESLDSTGSVQGRASLERHQSTGTKRFSSSNQWRTTLI